MVYIKEYKMDGEFLMGLDDYSRIRGDCRIVSINENDKTIILVKGDGFLVIGETKEEITNMERGLEGLFGDRLNKKAIELDIP